MPEYDGLRAEREATYKSREDLLKWKGVPVAGNREETR